MGMSMPSPPDFTALDWLYTTRLSSDSIITAERLDFLAHFTSENGMGTFLAPETLKERQEIIRQDEAAVEHHLAKESSIPVGCLHTIEPSMLHVDVNPIMARSFEILHHLHSTVTRKTDRSVVKFDWTAEVERQCRTFFASGNITRFLRYFWSLWYPNCPFIHRASFNANTAPIALLCVMLLIGACLSPHSVDANKARMWLDCVEELAFSDSSFCEETGGGTGAILSSSVDRKKKRLECIQTAYLVCSLQKREGSADARARVRRYRNATMVMLARDVGLATASHRDLSMDKPSEMWWQQFAVEEGLIRSDPHKSSSQSNTLTTSRTMTYVFLFDAALTIFHNSPPRMVVSELKMELACPEACFQAESAEECFAALKEWEHTTFWRRHLPLVAVVKSICEKEPSPKTASEYAKMGTLNLFTAVQSLHSLTFHLQNSLIFESTLAPIERGLENWRQIWERREAEDKHVHNTPGSLWKKVGFISYSPEFWHLARIIVERIHDDDATAETATSPEVTGTVNAAKMRYDHTDMTDVNGLIMEYRRFCLGPA
ncbi:transcription factor domain-containing protein [Aspergillus undulatus]|uniref:transcription factor domain-containing protein n=1 Tax=Aspergillus undulatus TaxID=1810928 RepID=UPI003CCD472E